MKISIYADYIDMVDNEVLYYRISAMDRWGRHFKITGLSYEDREEAEICRKHFEEFAQFVTRENVQFLQNFTNNMKDGKL